MVANEAETEADSALFRVAQRSRHAGVGDGDNQVRGNAGFACKLAAHLVAALLHPAAEDAAVGPREVDVLKDATGLLYAGGVLAAGHAVFSNHNQFAGENVA